MLLPTPETNTPSQILLKATLRLKSLLKTTPAEINTETNSPSKYLILKIRYRWSVSLKLGFSMVQMSPMKSLQNVRHCSAATMPLGDPKLRSAQTESCVQENLLSASLMESLLTNQVLESR